MKFTPFAIALLVMTPGLAAAEPDLPDIRVSHADLDLRSVAGVKVLDRRLARAIRSACLEADGTVDVAFKLSVHRCLVTKTAEVAEQRTRVLSQAATKGMVASSVP